MSEYASVHLKQGDLRGRKATTRFGVKYFSFQGIPYAKPPVGDLRFKAPQPPEPWQGVRDALQEGAESLQINVLQNNACVGDEDCLFLNVYTLELPDGKKEFKKPVMVWVHGGGFCLGSGGTALHGPDYLVEEDVVLVSINYRLGPLGFLSLPEAGVPGNNGMKDQVMALRWVQQNIVQFGGNPDNVTLFGTSAGAASVLYHMMSPLSKGLFHRAIALSGTTLNPWAYDDPVTARNKAFQLGEMLGLKTTDPKELLQFLQKKSAKDMIKGLYEALTDEDKVLLTIYCVPTCDKAGNTEEVFLPDSPLALLREGKFLDVPLMTGIMAHEGILMLKEVTAKPSLWEYLDNNFEVLLPSNLDFNNDKKLIEQTAQKVRKYYYGDKRACKDTQSCFIELITDTHFFYGIDYTVKQHVAFCKSPVYLYKFAFEGKFALLKKLIDVEHIPGACHGDDTAYIFNPSVLDVKLDPDMIEVKVIRRMTKLFSNFARTGYPTPEEDPLLGITWKPVTKASMPYMIIGNELELSEGLRKENIEFWNEIYKSVSWKST